ncbi:hypothetical protein JJB07_00750 [Tumebacillus sp. ITR2]|uniref:Uncharacterized protein n=1 Tax=Tumebacillus amylolyticus TaxID=2801339 RepID=A0ABS1J4P7_9BACL|nr:hypothetical protein [Tumebacillus amylolyticus]MBL0385160.1 hypothetical protein [Tumebacillus amylolyticus]
MLSEKYLELGLIGLGRAGEEGGWFGGHTGAAVLAAFYMSREENLPEHVQVGLQRMADHFISKFPKLFVPYEKEQADPALLEVVLDGLRANAARLSHSGHGLAYGFLALRALTERPDMLIPSLVNGFSVTLTESSKGSGNRYYGLADYSTFTVEQVTEIPAYNSLQDLAERALEECRVIVPTMTLGEKRYHFTGEVEHGLTHAQALMEFDRLGYSFLTESGMVNHRIQMQLNRRIPEEVLHMEIVNPPFESLFAPEYWENVYDDPHCLKVPYAALYLLNRLPQEKRAKAERDVCKILCQMK